MLILDPLVLQPVYEMWEVVRDFLADEDPVDHVAAKQPHFYLVPQVQIDLLVLMDALENVRSCRSVREFQLIKTFLHNVQRVAFLEVLDRHVLNDVQNQSVSVLESELRFQLFLLEFITIFFVFFCLSAFLPGLG